MKSAGGPAVPCFDDLPSATDPEEFGGFALDVFRTALNTVMDGVFLLDPVSLRIVDVNAAGCGALGHPRDDLIGRSFWRFSAGNKAVSVARAVDRLSCGDQRLLRLPTVLRRSDDAQFPVELSVQRLNSAGQSLVVAVAHDISDRKRFEELALAPPYRDPLTGLANRTAMESFLASAAERSMIHGLPIAVYFIDLNEFKQVNDTLGHAAGDRILTSIGQRLRMSVRPTDAVARYGGDEFVVLIENPQSDHEIVQLAKRLSSRLAHSISLEDRVVAVTASIGIAVSDGPPDDIFELIRSADRAMYRAKSSGKSCRWYVHHLGGDLTGSPF